MPQYPEIVEINILSAKGNYEEMKILQKSEEKEGATQNWNKKNKKSVIKK